jgi:Tfp pilus assembly protein PilF
MKRLVTLLLPLLLAACATTKAPAPAAPDALFADARFAPPSEKIGTRDLFTLSPEMRAYVRSNSFTAQLRTKGTEKGLVDALYAKRELRLEYDASLTRTAAETYAAKAGNCLSLVIMTAAFAKELNMRVQYQNVVVEDTWSRNSGLIFSSSHVNLTIGRRLQETVQGYNTPGAVTIDFLSPEDAAAFRTVQIDEATIEAMYMNNRAAEALASGRSDDAYWWAREVVKTHPKYVSGFNTLGVVYQRRGDFAEAETVFREALRRDPDNLVIMNNLVPVLAALDRHEESRALAAKVARAEPYPPFHFYDLGLKAMQAGNYLQAKALFQREVARAPYYHEFHFWLAQAHYQLGETKPAREQLALAAQTSTTPGARDKYQHKLWMLKAGGGRSLR